MHYWVERTKEKERKKIVSIIDMQLACKDVEEEGGGETNGQKSQKSSPVSDASTWVCPPLPILEI